MVENFMKLFLKKKERKKEKQERAKQSFFLSNLSFFKNVDIFLIDFYSPITSRTVRWPLVATREVGKCIFSVVYHYLEENQNL